MSERPHPEGGAFLEYVGLLALQWVAADTNAKALRKARAEIISRFGGCSRNNQRGPDGYTLGPCYTESRPDFEGCACCNESQPAHLAYRSAVAKASAFRRKLKRVARILASASERAERSDAQQSPTPNPPSPERSPTP